MTIKLKPTLLPFILAAASLMSLAGACQAAENPDTSAADAGKGRVSVASDYNAVDEYSVRKFSKVPPVGVHPRVLMSPEDLPAWRQNVINTYRGKDSFAKRYQSSNINQLTEIPALVQDKDLLAAFPKKGPDVNHEILFATLDVIYHEDAERAKTVCRALANFGRLTLARSKYDPEWGKIKKDIDGVKGDDGIATGLGDLWLRGGEDFALAYDYLYNYMTAEQRDICRKALSAARRTSGPSHRLRTAAAALSCSATGTNWELSDE